ncbi:MAG TPA: alpha-hydroxy acid oxidase [Actinocrinis sp.]|nr:alpha-hydroxy acid oxidase [Actinocrinis sp.]
MTDEAAAPGARDLVELADFAAAARQLLPQPIWDFLDGGSGTESMVDANRAVLDRMWLRPQVLTGTSEVDLATTLLGAALSAPLGVAPVSHQRLYHPEGEVAAARAAGEAGMLFVTSIFASRPIEDIAAASKGPVWQQLYWLRDRTEFERFIARSEDAGVSALVLTVDAPVVARRPRDIRNAFVLPSDVSAVNLDAAVMQATHESQAGTSAIARHAAQQFQPGLGWSDLAWLRQRTQLPVLLKGVLSARDAFLAQECGVDGVIVSNHGGRQLDGSVPAVYALPEIADAVGNRCAVLVDGAFRRGHDVLKALMLGAHAVLLGRPAMWGLTCAGADGVAAVLDLVRAELAEAMLLSGLPNIAYAAAAEFVSDQMPTWAGSAHE